MDYVGAIILAAGQGKRMKSSVPKVLHNLCGKPIIQHVLDHTSSIADSIYLVIGYQGEEVKEYLNKTNYYNIEFVYQEQQRGTGDAVKMAQDLLPDNGKVLVLCGDTPLISAESLKGLFQMGSEHDVVILTAKVPNPYGYGRIIRDKDNRVITIEEEKNLNPNQAKVDEINTGTYCFAIDKLKKYLPQIEADSDKGEYYLTDIISLMVKEGHSIGAFLLDDYREGLGINDLYQLAEAAKVMRNEINYNLMTEGVTIVDPDSTYIDKGVSIGNDTIIYPQTLIEGKTEIGSGCQIGPNTTIRDTIIKDRVMLTNSVVEECIIREEAKIGPFAYLRPGNDIGHGVKIGDFVEVKNSNIANGSKIPHLSYVGDADVGEGVNFGAGTIIVNYDGTHKHRTMVARNSFIGCNSNLIAPLKIGEGSYIAAGSTINKDVAEGSMVFARCRQENKPGLAKRFLKKE